MKEYLCYRIADALSRLLPRRFGYWLSLRVADRFYRRDEKGRAAVKVNLRHILEYRGMHLSEQTLESLARKTFQHFGKSLVDFFRFSRMSRKQVRRLVSIEHPEYIQEAQAAGKGVLVITAHQGNYEMGAAVFSALGYPFKAVVLPQRMRKVNELFQKRRRQRGLGVIPLGSAVRSILQALRRQEFVALLADRDYSPRNDLAPFFGAKARFPRGPAWFCMKTGAPILPGFLLRHDDDTFLLRFHPPIVPEQHWTQEDIQREICGVLEHEIGASPDQWFMFDAFWNTPDSPPPIRDAGRTAGGTAAGVAASGSDTGHVESAG